jgi:hypothetical protein
MAKKINILLNPEEIKKVKRTSNWGPIEDVRNGDGVYVSEKFSLEGQRKLWTRLIELGMISEHHDCIDWSRAGHSPDHSPFCRWCRIKKELGLK